LVRRDFFGIPGAKSPVEDPVYILGTRDYQHWRPARHIHWKASARHNRLQEKVFEPSEQEKVQLAVDVSPFERDKQSESFERTLEVVASLAVQFYHRGCAVGFVTNGVVEGGASLLPMGRSPQHLSSVLEILARLKMKAHESLANRLYQALETSWGASCVHFSHEPDGDTAAAARYFRHKGIPTLYVVCSSRASWERDARELGGPVYGLDEICAREAQKG
jgi:hypothetical protein